MGSPAHLGDPDFPIAQGFQTVFGLAANVKPVASAAAPLSSAITFPQIVPPSAESLMADASPAVVEAELRRLMGDWISGLDVLADVFDRSLASGVGGRGDGDGDGGASVVGE